MRVEKLTFVRQELPNKPRVQDLRAALVNLERARLDAIWLPNDNALLSPRFLANVWLPYVSRLGAPVVVAVPSLVNEHAEFGTFAAIPDTQRSRCRRLISSTRSRTLTGSSGRQTFACPSP